MQRGPHGRIPAQVELVTTETIPAKEVFREAVLACDPEYRPEEPLFLRAADYLVFFLTLPQHFINGKLEHAAVRRHNSGSASASELGSEVCMTDPPSRTCLWYVTLTHSCRSPLP